MLPRRVSDLDRSSLSTEDDRPRMETKPAVPRCLTTPYLGYESSSGYVTESWSSKEHFEQKAREKEAEESSCWCTRWWMVTGTPGVPWVAHYVL